MVGIDIERIDRFEHWNEEGFKRIFSELEIEYANKLVSQIKNIVAISEDYPELKSNTLFKSLMEQLVDVEDRIASARRIYDSNVSLYNMEIEQFPNNIIAKMYKFEKEELFKIESGEAIATKINLG